MSTWLLRNGTATNAIGHSNANAGFSDTYAITRYYQSFDTSTITASLTDITSVKFYVMVTANTGTETYKCHSAISSDANWGATLVADLTDFTSTAAHLEDSISVGGTGVQYFDIDKNNLDLSGTTYFRIMSNGEANLPETKNMTIGSSSNSTVANRPYLEVTSSDGTVQRLLASTGVGI